MRNSEGGFAGLDVDVATYVAQRLGTGARDITFVEARPADRETLLEQNKVDLVLEQQPSYREWVDALLKGDTRRGQVTSACGRWCPMQLAAVRGGQPGQVRLPDPASARRLGQSVGSCVWAFWTAGS